MTDVASLHAGEAPTGDETEALVERLFAATIESLEIASVHLGCTLGLYRALADGGDATPAELAARTGTAERYVREWLEQQAVAGFLTVDDVDAETGRTPLRRCPPRTGAVFVDEQDLRYLAPLSSLVIGVCGPMNVLAAYRRGDRGSLRGLRRRRARRVAALNRPMFANQLAGWLAAIPEVDGRLRATPPARVADLACGSAWSSIAIARAYPAVTVGPSTWTRRRSRPPAATSPGRAGRPGARTRPRRRRASISMAPTTWSRSSRRCTT